MAARYSSCGALRPELPRAGVRLRGATEGTGPDSGCVEPGARLALPAAELGIRTVTVHVGEVAELPHEVAARDLRQLGQCVAAVPHPPGGELPARGFLRLIE